MQAALAQSDDGGLFADAEVFGGGLSEEAELHLHMAAESYHMEAVAELHLRAAQREAPDHVAVLIGLYRFYFYRSRLAEALEIAQLCLRRAALEVGLNTDWRKVRRGDAPFTSLEAFMPRFYLWTLKGYAYLQLRLGELIEGETATLKLLELDPEDKFGGSVLFGVLERARLGDDDY